MVMWTEFHPPTAPVTWPCLQPHPNLVCPLRHRPAISALCYLGIAHIFGVFVFTPSLRTFCRSSAFRMRIDVKAQSVLLCGLEFHLARARPDVGGCRVFKSFHAVRRSSLWSRNREFVFLVLGKVPGSDGHLLDIRSGDRVLQEEL